MWSLDVALASCLSDYRVSQRVIPHHLEAETIAVAERLALAGLPSKGWRVLGEKGDPYAQIAAKVVEQNPKFPGVFYQKLIRTHWININGKRLVELHFADTAKQHFKQYVEIIKTGFWPDSDQILMSYLKAVRDHGLPDVTVFDAAWDAAGFNSVRSWQRLNRLPRSRIVEPTEACFTIDREEAKKVILRDFSEVPLFRIFHPQTHSDRGCIQSP